MDPSTKQVTYLAPGAVSSTSMRFPGADSTLDPDDHLVEPEMGQEVWRGERIEVSPARPGHGDTHARLDAMVELCTRAGYIASSDLLTRRSEDNNFATDACVRRAGTNPETGYRYLEELCFEVFHTQSRSQASDRARDVIASGVRRMIGLFVRPAGSREELRAEAAGDVAITVEEWSPADDAWIPRSPTGFIHDPCLDPPLPVAALIDATALDDAAVRILDAKRNPTLETIKESCRRVGFCDGKRESLYQLLELRGLDVTPAQRAIIDGGGDGDGCEDPERFARWFERALSASSAAEILALNGADGADPRPR